ncbi:MAG: rhodanese-like domain-containing protein, partial [Actinomycetota bacterium]|nr:rhodanese-like domain-containing protein [Actinomycetota bacterium]
MENFDPLVTTDWLAEHLDDPKVRVVDIRGYVKKTPLGDGRQSAEYLGAREEYDEAHVPGAVYVDWTRDITDPDDPVPVQVAPPERFAKLMGSLGIGDDTHVVVYDHAGGQFATRLWWALTYYGHDEVSVLDGGWRKWTAEGRPTPPEVPEPEPAAFTPRPRPEWRKEAEDVLAASERGGAKKTVVAHKRGGKETRATPVFILDARDEGQYTGAVARGEGRAGRVPGAAHLHADSLFDPQSGTFRPDEELAEKLREAGVPEDRDAPLVAYCNG